MQVHLNTDNHFEGTGRKEDYWSEVAHEKLKRFEERISTLEIHLADENNGAKKGAVDKVCSIEARVSGYSQLSASCKSDSIEKAIAGALDKLKHVLEHALDKTKAH
jgi:hypothetical protein